MWWQLTTALNACIAVCYLLIAGTVIRGLVRTGQGRANVLAVATAAIFLSCAAHHGSHSIHMLLPALGWERHEGLAMRAAMGWHAAIIDVIGASVAIWYLSLRGRYGVLVHGPSLFADVRAEQRRAVEINDDVVQALTTVLYALELGEPETAAQAAEQGLASARRVMGDLASSAGRGLEPGDLRRGQPSVGSLT